MHWFLKLFHVSGGPNYFSCPQPIVKLANKVLQNKLIYLDLLIIDFFCPFIITKYSYEHVSFPKVIVKQLQIDRFEEIASCLLVYWLADFFSTGLT